MAAKKETAASETSPATGEEPVNPLHNITVPPGCAALIGGGGGCSFDGLEYGPNEHGVVVVPEAAAKILESHGFTRLT